MRVAIVGCGYVGLVSGVGLASIGHDVVGIDSDAARIAALQQGHAPFHEPGLDQALAKVLRTGKFRATSELSCSADAEAILLCVQTPTASGGGADLHALETAARDLAAVLASSRDRRCVVAVRSTVPPGTTDALVSPIFLGSALVATASNPEFLREGSALKDFLNADRIVVGVREGWAAELMRRLYEPIAAPFLVTTPPTAELAKYASNALLATLISFSNQIARLAEASPGVDVEDVLAIVHRDRRFARDDERGRNDADPASIVTYLKAGCGYGGSCLPKDLATLIAYGHDRGVPVDLLDAVGALNHDLPRRVAALVEQRLGVLEGRRITVLGAAFKAGTDDMRESPGLRIVDELLARLAHVVLYDPLVTPEGLATLGLDIHVAQSLEEAVQQAEVCVVTTLDPEWSRVQVLVAERNGNRPLVVDGRRALDPSTFDEDEYLGIGRGEA